MGGIKRKVLFIVCLLALFLAFSCVAFAAEEGGVFSGLESLANFVKRIFVPAPNYFHNELGSLSGHVNERFAGLGQLYQLLHGFFSELSHPVTSGITFKLPNNYFFAGYRGMSIDFFQLAKPYISLLRDFLTACYTLIVAIACFHRLRTFFRE